MGDFNFPEIDWNLEICSTRSEHPAAQFLTNLQDCFVQQLVTEPTHYRALQKANILDLLLVKDESHVSNIMYYPPIGKSHHSVITFEMPIFSSEQNKLKGKYYLMDRGEYGKMKDELNAIDWASSFKNKSVDEAWYFLYNTIQRLQDKHIPSKHFFTGTKHKTVSTDVLDKIKIKRKAYKWFRKYRTKENFNAYAKARNQVTWVLRKQIKQKELLIAKNIKTNPKTFFNYVTSRCKSKETVSSLLTPLGELTKTDKEKAEVLNEFFASVFTKEDTNNVPVIDKKTVIEISSVSITEDMIKNKLNQLKVDKAAGPDKLQPRLLKELKDSLTKPLKLLFDKSIACGKIPSSWKVAEVKPIFKKGNKQSAENYRPISLTSVVCKLFEGFIRDSLTKHLIDNKLLSDSQYGFTAGRSCVTQLLSTINDWFLKLEEGNSVDAFYLDLQKAFDTVPHARLISKLNCYGIGGSLLSWISDFLTQRTQYVKIGNDCSGYSDVTSGVPQGSVLGPTLFIFYINDMPDVLNCLVKIFADDTKIYQVVNDKSDAASMQTNINKLTEWANTWQIKFNSGKCKVMHLGHQNNQYEYFMEENKLETTSAEKDLGVIVDPKLLFDDHVSQTVKKANRLCGMLVSNIQCKEKDIMVPLFKALVRPVLEYGNSVWTTCLKKHNTAIENVQRRFTKKIVGLQELSYEQRLETIKLPSLEFRRLL